MNIHPFLWIRDTALKGTFLAAATLAIAAMLVLQSLGAPLQTPEAPAGIVSFELAGNLANSAAILASWDPAAKVSAGVNLGLDYLFIVAYVTAIGIACMLVSYHFKRNMRHWGMAGILLAWGILLAGVLDCVENYALISLLLGSQAEILPVVARFCAIPKFTLVFLGLIYVLIGSVASVLMSPGGRKSAA